jgi:superfamily II DNA or RNA helicase
MLCRDGGLALSDTLKADTKMGDLMGETITPQLDTAPNLHKLSACRAALDEHDFDKAVLFVDRVVVAKRLADELDEHNTVTVLGRLRSGSKAQQKAVDQAQDDETDLIIATAAGEEGMDLPKADLLVVWSNVVSAVRFIQRLGRVMRQGERDQPKAAVYLATPESPDYTSLRRGIVEAEQAGLDISRLDENLILDKTEAGQVQAALASGPQQLDQITQMLQQPETKIENWLRTMARNGEVCYLYYVPEDLDAWRSPGPFEGILGDVDGVQQAAETRNNLSPTKEQRYYLNEEDLPVIETEYPDLISGDRSHRLEVSFGPSHENNHAYSAYGTVESVVNTMREELGDAERFYATVSYSSARPTYSFQMLYQGSPSEAVISAVIRNADAIATRLEANQQITTGAR